MCMENEYGLSTLHAWIRCMEMILHISYNPGFEKWTASNPENKKIKDKKKKRPNSFPGIAWFTH